MISVLSASSTEADEPDLCVLDFLAQLDLKNRLKRHAVGLMFGPLQPLEPLAAVCRALPFDVTGIVSPLTSVPSVRRDPVYDTFTTTLTALTSDEDEFVAGLSEEIGDEDERGPIVELYERLAAKLSRPPKLILAFSSRARPQGDHLINWLDKASDGRPVVGSYASSYTYARDQADLLFNGALYTNRVALVLIDAQAEPRFFFFSTPGGKRLRHRALITSSDGNLIKEVNGRPVLEYFAGLGLVDEDGSITGARATPIFIESPDHWRDLPMVASSLNAEGHVLCSLDVPPNATLGLGGFDVLDVIDDMRGLIRNIKRESFDFCLIFSCVTRNRALGLSYLREIHELETALGDKLPYCFAYSGGELCPVLDGDGRQRNAFHNLALVGCLL
ncbi:MAG: FIST C-terminal domain-containing protein [Deltaproteobacteria bacterium]|jgi:hypothetical protein|nr:FIST C-terminal domain-containing protein [Deltaproteobacteria bacterium]